MDQSKMPLYEKLLAHKRDEPISFHVPGHKNGALYYDLNQRFAQFLEYDVTELTGLDDLHSPDGVISEAQQLLSHLYRTKKSYFLVNGSTVGNLAMILAVCNDGDSVLVQRNCHKSILNGLMIANVKPIFISPDMNEEQSFAGGMNPNTVKKAFENDSNIKACIFTYPDYYGETYDLQAIIDIAHSNGAKVLIDEAHGPHFQIGTPFPPSALELGADIVVHSAHKMLPAMTMGSYFHINSDQVSKEKVEFYLSALQSSSPSYPIMASLDMARHYLATYSKEDLAYTLQIANQLMDEVEDIPSLTARIKDDPLKVTIQHESLTGYELQSALEKVGVFPELADPYQVLLVLPLLKSGADNPFADAVERLKSACFENRKKRTVSPKIDLVREKVGALVYSYKDMLDKPFEWVNFNEAVGRVAAKMIIPYPPGTPLLLAGERITSEHIERMEHLLSEKARFQGGIEYLREGKIAIYSQ